MPRINLFTTIEAPIDRVFDLARSIDLHKLSTKGTNEEAIEGITSGLIGLNETVTWRAKHFGIYQRLTVKIIEFNRPKVFVDRMVKGAFKSMEHTHKFKQEGNTTLMLDEFEFESPLGILGRLANVLFLKSYMTNFLKSRNLELKLVAEGKDWENILK